MAKIDKIRGDDIPENQEENIGRDGNVVKEVKDVLVNKKTFSFTKDIENMIFFNDFRHIENMYENGFIDQDTKNIMHSQSEERGEINLTIGEISKKFFKTLGFYSSDMVLGGVKEYNVFKDKKIDFYIKKMFLQDIKMKENFNEDDLMNIIYNDLKNFLLDGNIRIGEYGRLVLDKEDIKIVVSEDLSNIGPLKKVRSKRLKFD